MARHAGLAALFFLALAALPACEAGQNIEVEKAVARIRRLQGTVETDDKAPGKPVVGVSLVACKVADDDLGVLAAFTQLQSLNLGLSSVTDAGLARLPKLGKLQTLELTSTEITDAGLAQLKGLTGL